MTLSTSNEHDNGKLGVAQLPGKSEEGWQMALSLQRRSVWPSSPIHLQPAEIQRYSKRNIGAREKLGHVGPGAALPLFEGLTIRRRNACDLDAGKGHLWHISMNSEFYVHLIISFSDTSTPTDLKMVRILPVAEEMDEKEAAWLHPSRDLLKQ